MITELKKQFNYKGNGFTQVYKTENHYVYKVKILGKNHFEVFEIKTTPVCIDFEKKVYSDIDKKEIYPKDKDFGTWAWCFCSIDKAMDFINKGLTK